MDDDPATLALQDGVVRHDGVGVVAHLHGRAVVAEDHVVGDDGPRLALHPEAALPAVGHLVVVEGALGLAAAEHTALAVAADLAICEHAITVIKQPQAEAGVALDRGARQGGVAPAPADNGGGVVLGEDAVGEGGAGVPADEHARARLAFEGASVEGNIARLDHGARPRGVVDGLGRVALLQGPRAVQEDPCEFDPLGPAHHGRHLLHRREDDDDLPALLRLEGDVGLVEEDGARLVVEARLHQDLIALGGARDSLCNAGKALPGRRHPDPRLAARLSIGGYRVGVQPGRVLLGGRARPRTQENPRLQSGQRAAIHATLLRRDCRVARRVLRHGRVAAVLQFVPPCVAGGGGRTALITVSPRALTRRSRGRPRRRLEAHDLQRRGALRGALGGAHLCSRRCGSCLCSLRR
mmetsp:Transcript_57728/g.141606  ORF Transcript_57728/g.141606 Transcript_57728/m.141606 type:complete len:410 (-) Transcript_57728:8-1237(-)